MEVKVCPRCHSQNVSWSTVFKAEQRTGIFRDKCSNCGYIGTMVIMDKEDADKLEVLDPDDIDEKPW